jgi:hypothetical protein
MKAAYDDAGRHQRRTRGECRGAPTGGGPQGDVVPIAAQQGGVAIGNRASSKNGNPHGTVLQISLRRYRGSRSFSARDSALSSLPADSNSRWQVAIERF